MPITYTNRKDRTYHLCQGLTKTGKPRYYFAREPRDTPVEEIPEGYEIRESANGTVSLGKVRAILLLGEEIDAVNKAVQAHPEAKNYRVEVKPKQIIIHERFGPDFSEVLEILAPDLVMPSLSSDRMRQLEEVDRMHAPYSPALRFVLKDAQNRRFGAQRLCLFNGTYDWMDIAYDDPLADLVAAMVPTLGTDQFFELM